ncbi:MAG TPA: hypothetical protein VEJ36_03710 [Nitrososphaerales archaeon]|nr:hypothetical protein [Nitrososphaerales archaeon]
MLFTVGTGYFLWTSTLNGNYSSALANRAAEIQSGAQESLLLSATDPGGADLSVTITNTGGIAVNVTDLFVTEPDGVLYPPSGVSFSSPLGTNPNTDPALPLPIAAGETVEGILTPDSVAQSGSYSIRVLTARGNTFSAIFQTVALSTTLLPSSNQLALTPIYDSANITGGTSPTGSITFYAFTSSTCSAGSNVYTSQAIAVNGEGQYFSNPSYTPTQAGSYYWQAIYSGDANNPSITSTCGPSGEVLTVGSNPTVTTSFSPSSTINIGQQVFDQATLTGVAAGTQGTMKFWYSTQDTCPAISATEVGTGVSVDGDGTYSSSATQISFSSAGTYYWYATFAQGTNPAVTSACEPLSVLADPTITTSLSSQPAAVGEPVSDTATIVGGDDAPYTGSVLYYYSATDSCPANGATLVSSVPLNPDGSVPTSAAVSFPTAGTYYWYAVYSGDGNNQGVVSPCEALLVGSEPTISTTLSQTSIPVGGSTSDSASITGATSGASGTLKFWFSTVDSCPENGATQVGSGQKGGNGVYSSGTSTTFNTAGTYYWYANYTGDTNNLPATSACEPLTVGLAITTTLSAQTILVGASVTDSATIQYPTGIPTGTVTYYDSSANDCSGGNAVNTVTLTASGSAPPSTAVAYSSAGSYSWYAVYSGGGKNAGPVTSPCEPLTVLASTSTTSSGSLGLVSESFRFYFSNCNSEDNSGTCPPGAGDGVSVGGYYGYGLSFNPLPTCAEEFFFGCFGGAQTVANPDVFQIKVSNTDPSRTITLSPESFLFIQGQCAVGFFCDFLSTPFAQSYWIISPPSGSGGEGAVPQPYNVNNPVTIAPGATATLYFYCTGGPCTSAVNPGAGGTENAPPPGESLVVSVGLFGLYSDGTPFAQTIPYVASYVSPVYIESVSPAQPPGALYITGGIGSTITLTATDFPTLPSTVSVYWTNTNGVTQVVGTASGSSCTPVTERNGEGETSTVYTCTVSFTVPPSATPGNFYGIYVTSDGVDNAYATVGVTGASSTTVTCNPSTVAIGSTSSCQATVTGTSPTGTVTWSQSGTGSLTLPTPATCTLAAVSGSVSQCSITVTGKTAGSVTLTATYPGDVNNQGSSGSTGVTIGDLVTFSASAISSGGDVPGGTTIVSITIGGTGSTCTGGTPTPVTATLLGTSGYSVVVTPGTDVCYSYASPIASNAATKQYVWSSTSGTGSAAGLTTQAGSFTINANSVVTGAYTIQYQVTFAVSPTGTGTTAPSGTLVWENAGSLAISATPNSGYAFASWSSSTGSITFASSTSASTTATISGSGTITANFAIAYTVTFDAPVIRTAGDVSGSTTVLTVTIGGTGATCTGGTATAVKESALPDSFTVATGTDVCYAYSSPISTTSAGVQFAWSSTSGTGSASAVTTQSGSFTLTSASTVTATYVAQYQVTFASSGLDSSATGTVVTVNGNAETYTSLPYSVYITSGQQVTFAWTATVSSSTSGKQFIFSSSTQASPYTVTGVVTITGTYTPQYKITLTDTGIGSDTSTNTVLTVNTGGTGATCTGAGSTSTTLTQGQLPFTTGYLSSGTCVYFAYTSPVATTATTKQYSWSSTGSTGIAPAQTGQTGQFTATAVGTITGTYVTQYQITFAVTPSGSGTTAPTGTSVWENAGALAITATPGSGYTFTSWSSSTGSITFASATSASTTATIGGSGTITATFVKSKGLDSPGCVAYGSVASGTTLSATLTSCQANDLIVVVITGSSTTETVSSVTATGLTFTARTSETGNGESVFEYYAYTTTALTSELVTVTMSAAHSYDVEVFGVTGVSSSSKYDPNASVPGKATGTGGFFGTDPSVTGISTTNPTDLIVGLEGDSSGTIQTAGTGFTLLASHTNTGQVISVEYEIVSSTQSGVTVSFGTATTDWVMIADAIDPASSSQIRTSLSAPQHLGQTAVTTAPGLAVGLVTMAESLIVPESVSPIFKARRESDGVAKVKRSYLNHNGQSSRFVLGIMDASDPFSHLMMMHRSAGIDTTKPLQNSHPWRGLS